MHSIKVSKGETMILHKVLQVVVLCFLISMAITSNSNSVDAAPLSTLYVDAAAGDDSGNDCRTSTSPCRTIQRAVNQAQSGDTILVGAGTYTYAGTDNPCDQYLGGLKAVVCLVNTKLVLRGGYLNGDWSTSNPAANPTIIDGENRVRGVYVLSADPNKASTAGIEMEGFTVRNGYTRGADTGTDTQTFAFGGGMLTDYAYVTLRNMRFENNVVVGGGTQNEYGGSASGGGVAIRRTPGRATIENVVFQSNRAESGAGLTRSGYALGGGLYLLLSEADGTALEFYDNVSLSGSTTGNGQTADGQSGDAFGAGATIMGYADVNFTNIVAKDNRTIGGNAAVRGGGAFGGAIKVEGIPEYDANGDGVNETATVRIYGCEISNNLAQGGSARNGGIAAGGGIETIHSTLIVNGCRIQDNNAQGGNGGGAQGPAGGGGLYLQNISYPGPTATVKNSIIAFNSVAAGQGSPVGGGGGGLWLQGIETTLIHNTIVGNRMFTNPLQGSAIMVISDGAQGGPKPAHIRYNIIANHTDSDLSAIHVKRSDTANLAHNLMHGNASNINSFEAGTVNGMDTSIFTDPLFQIEPTADGSRAYQISPASPAVNQAIGSTEAVDSENGPRTDIPDLGAYEAAPFTISVKAIASQSLYVYWGQHRGVRQYRLDVKCPAGLSGNSCNTSTFHAGDTDGVTLTGLSNYANYTIDVGIVDASGNVSVSQSSTGMPTDLFVFIPNVAR
jgi:hypothetical protein